MISLVLMAVVFFAISLSVVIISEINESAGKTPKSKKFAFPEILSEYEFEYIVKNAAKRIKRIEHVSVDGATVECRVISQSKITYWTFTLDFNDRGKLTGKYCIFSENEDSQIPRAVGSVIVDELNKRGINSEYYKKKRLFFRK